MIFVTIGTSEPFDRLIDAFDGFPGEEPVRIQCGTSTSRPDRAELVDYLPFDELLETMKSARIVVTHAGVGSILASLTAGKRPIVVPRRRTFGEAIDDHQVALGQRLGEAGLVTYVDDPASLLATVERAKEEVSGTRTDGRLAEEIRDYLDLHIGCQSRPLPARAR